MTSFNFQLVALEPENIDAAFKLLEIVENVHGVTYRNAIFWRRRNAISRCLGCMLVSNGRAAGLILFPTYNPFDLSGTHRFDLAELPGCPPHVGLQCFVQPMTIVMGALTASRNGPLYGLVTECPVGHPARDILLGFGASAESDEGATLLLDKHCIVAAARELSKYLGGIAAGTVGSDGKTFVYLQQAGFVAGLGFLAVNSALARGDLSVIGHNIRLLSVSRENGSQRNCAA